jgi:hypothetical protein
VTTGHINVTGSAGPSNIGQWAHQSAPALDAVLRPMIVTPSEASKPEPKAKPAKRGIKQPKSSTRW